MSSKQLFKSLKIQDDIVLCTRESHIKIDNYFCKDCSESVCSKCSKSLHKSHRVEMIDKIYKETMNKLSDFSNKIEKMMEFKLREKEINEFIFKTDAQDHYDREISLISDHFRKLHDSLHIKEVELKRELHSHYEENLLSFTSIISSLENEIEKSKIYSIQCKEILDNNNNNNNNNIKNNNNNNIDDNNDNNSKSTFLKTYNIINEMINNQKSQRPNYSICKTNFDMIDDISSDIEFIELIQISPMDRYMYITPKSGDFYRIDIDRSEYSLLPGKVNGHDCYLGGNVGNIFDRALCGDFVYYFDGNHYFRINIDPFENGLHHQWMSGTITLHSNNATGYSTCYDPLHDVVYVSGGYLQPQSEDISDIYLVDLKTLKSMKIGNLPQPIALHTMIMAPDNQSFYIIAGFNSQNTNRIDQYLIKENKVVNIKEFDIPIINGCYNWRNQTFYMITDQSPIGLLCYNRNTKKNSLLSPPPPIQNPNGEAISIFKLFFDGVNTIYFIYPVEPYKEYIFKYNIQRDQWSQIKLQLVANNFSIK